MQHSIPRAWLASLLLFSAFAACGVDDRPLSFEYHALDAAGASAAAGTSTAGAPGGSQNSNAGAAQGGDFSAHDGGAAGDTPSEAGSPANAHGGNNESGGGSEVAGGSEVGGTFSGGAPAMGGASAAGGSSQAGGGGSVFPCGDLNSNSVDDCVETLVQNSRFDSAATSWDAEASLTQAWDASNGSSQPGSGSLELNDTAVIQAVGTGVVGSHQCIPATPGTTYDFAARIMLAAGTMGGQGGINVWMFDDAACQGNLVPGNDPGGNTPVAGGVAGTWTALSGKLWIAGGVHSMYVRLVAIKPFAQASLTVFIDDVLVAKH